MSGPWPARNAAFSAALRAGLSYQVILTLTPGFLASKFRAAFSRHATFAGSSASWLHMVILVSAAAEATTPATKPPIAPPTARQRHARPLVIPHPMAPLRFCAAGSPAGADRGPRRAGGAGLARRPYAAPLGMSSAASHLTRTLSRQILRRIARAPGRILGRNPRAIGR